MSVYKQRVVYHVISFFFGQLLLVWYGYQRKKV